MPIMHVDAFVKGPFSGNPAAVCWVESPRPDDWMQLVARELNLSETAFVTPRAGGFGLRWFTPATEVNLCGHATLASARALELWARAPTGGEMRFFTKSGWLTARSRGERIELDFPATQQQEAIAPPGLVAALSNPTVRFCGCGAGPLGDNYLLELGSAEQVRRTEPDFAALRRIAARSVVITAAAEPGSGYDFVSRFFAPRGGVDEDPVTGSAHTQLTPYWAGKLGRTSLRAWQASARGGELDVELRGDRVGLAGRCQAIWQGELVV